MVGWIKIRDRVSSLSLDPVIFYFWHTAESGKTQRLSAAARSQSRRSRRPRKNETAHDDDDAGGGGNDVRMNGEWFDAKWLKNDSLLAAGKSPSFAVENFFRFLFF